MKNVCLKCGLEYRPAQIGVPVVEMYLDPPLPYKIYTGDIHKCPGCGHKILTGFSKPIHHHEDSFQTILESFDGKYVTVREK